MFRINQTYLFILSFLILNIGFSQKKMFIAGPMLGYVEHRTAKIWFETDKSIDHYEMSLFLKEGKQNKLIEKNILPIQLNPFSKNNQVIHTFSLLEPNLTYTYKIKLVKKKSILNELQEGQFHTPVLWLFRTPAPNFNFLTGSCNYVNEAVYDRPGKPYGNDSTIYLTMAKDSADFMLWLGDNWYYREVDFGSVQGLYYRASRDRSQKTLQPLLKKMAHYAIWDDHDFGDNDSHSGFIFNNESRNLFQQYWANPSYGENGKGIYTTFQYSDVQFILLDDRTFRSSDNLIDTINHLPNTAKKMWGEQQMNWLFNVLANSRSTFKLIVTGSQVLNENSPFDGAFHYKEEYKKLLDFITQQKVEGVLFLTGDRHHSEVIEKKIQGFYPLYDITSSPLTSGSHYFSGSEKENPQRMVGVDNQQNYTQISITGNKKERQLKAVFKNPKGEILSSWQINEKDLKVK